MHIMKKQVLLIILLALPLWLKAADVSVTGLRTEQMVDPMGLDTAAPRMSWRLESSQRNVMQTAYRILVASSPELLAQDKGDLWDSGKVVRMDSLSREAFEKQSACLLESEKLYQSR